MGPVVTDTADPQRGRAQLILSITAVSDRHNLLIMDTYAFDVRINIHMPVTDSITTFRQTGARHIQDNIRVMSIEDLKFSRLMLAPVRTTSLRFTKNAVRVSMFTDLNETLNVLAIRAINSHTGYNFQDSGNMLNYTVDPERNLHLLRNPFKAKGQVEVINVQERLNPRRTADLADIHGLIIDVIQAGHQLPDDESINSNSHMRRVKRFMAIQHNLLLRIMHAIYRVKGLRLADHNILILLNIHNLIDRIRRTTLDSRRKNSHTVLIATNNGAATIMYYNKNSNTTKENSDQMQQSDKGRCGFEGNTIINRLRIVTTIIIQHLQGDNILDNEAMPSQSACDARAGFAQYISDTVAYGQRVRVDVSETYATR